MYTYISCSASEARRRDYKDENVMLHRRHPDASKPGKLTTTCDYEIHNEARPEITQNAQRSPFGRLRMLACRRFDVNENARVRQFNFKLNSFMTFRDFAENDTTHTHTTKIQQRVS